MGDVLWYYWRIGGRNCRRMMQPVLSCIAHSAAADVAARFGTRGMLATDLFHATAYLLTRVTDKSHDESSNSAP